MGMKKLFIDYYQNKAKKLQHQIAQQKLNWLNREFPEYKVALSMAKTKEEKKLVRQSFEQLLPGAWQNRPNINVTRKMTESQKIAQYKKDIRRMEQFKLRYEYTPQTYYKAQNKMLSKIGVVGMKEKIGIRKTRPVYYAINDDGVQVKVSNKQLNNILNAWNEIVLHKDYKYEPDLYKELATIATRDEVKHMSVAQIEQYLNDILEERHQEKMLNYEDFEDDGGDDYFPF